MIQTDIERPVRRHASRSIGNLVYLVYLDDSGTVGGSSSKEARYQIIGAVILHDKHFESLEDHFAFLHERLLEEAPPEKRQKIKFHTREVFQCTAPLDCLTRDISSAILSEALYLVEALKIPVVYGAADRHLLHKGLYASADPLDLAFRLCADGIEKWFEENEKEGLGLCIMDQVKGDKAAEYRSGVIHNSFKSYRRSLLSLEHNKGRLAHIHDDLYFGSAEHSVGIKLADLCTYFIMRHLEGKEDSEYLYKKIEPHIFSGKTEPRSE